VDYANFQGHAILEASQAMPGQGARSMFTVGLGYGVLLGVLTTLAIPYTRLWPHIWKRALGLGKDQEQARLRAMQLFPTADLRVTKHHGRAESRLLAYYSWQHQRQRDCKKRKGSMGEPDGHGVSQELLDEVATYANQRGFTLEEFLSWCIALDEGDDACSDAKEPFDEHNAWPSDEINA
jgi:hypothetical protein